MHDRENRLTQIVSRAAASPMRQEPAAEADAGQVEDCGAFGCLRGVRERAIMLELRRRDGSLCALGYAWLERIDFDPSQGITLRFAGQQVILRGRNLNGEVRPNLRLVDALCRQRVPWIQEADEPAALRAERQATVVERIEM